MSDAINIIKEEAADIFNIKVMKVGGLYQAKKIAAIAESEGIPCIVGGMLELGIGAAANRHFAFSNKVINMGYASEGIYNPLRLVPVDIINEKLPEENGVVTVPKDVPGLGVTINHKVIDKYLDKTLKVHVSKL